MRKIFLMAAIAASLTTSAQSKDTTAILRGPSTGYLTLHSHIPWDTLPVMVMFAPHPTGSKYNQVIISEGYKVGELYLDKDKKPLFRGWFKGAKIIQVFYHY